jgi:small conductance mechanosensitive channel
MSEDSRFRSVIVDMPQVSGVESVGSDGVAVKVTTRTRPSGRFDIEGELRRRLAEAFLAEGVRVPFGKVEELPADGRQPGGAEPDGSP